jgi:hypothetical protein
MGVITIAVALLSLSVGPPPPDDPPRVTNIEVVAGEPFGVGKITFEPAAGESLLALVDGYQLTEDDRRIFYPVLSQRFIDRVLDAATPRETQLASRLTVWFLFKGDKPLRLRLAGNETTAFEAPVQLLRPNAARRLVRQWWREYSAEARGRTTSGEIPPLVESYMVAMLARRLGFESEQLSGDASKRDPVRKTLDLVFDTESLKSGLMFELMTGAMPAGEWTQPLPEPIAWTPATPLPAGEVAIEPLATVVPAECFYLRFGSWQNQLWLKRLMAEYGGDLSRLIDLRGYKSPGSDRLLAQLALEPTKWDDLFGGSVIADIAVIGTDTYVADGASIGILFESSNGLFQRNLTSRRQQFAKEHAGEGVELQAIALGTTEATLMRSPDQSVRSFFVSADKFHLVTTSETLARRFLEAHAGLGRLSDEASFRQARRVDPVARQDTMFLFASDAFFHNLLSPKYQIELRRRAYADAARNVLQCAMWAAASEGLQTEDIQALIQLGFLPPEFFGYARPARGQVYVGHVNRALIAESKIPLADVEVDRVSPAEADWFRERAAYFTEKIGRFDPVVVAMKRFAVDESRERLAIDARIAPFSPGKYDWLGRMLGPPTADQLVGSQNDALTLQVSLQQDFLGPERTKDFYQLFAAVQNEPMELALVEPRRFLQTLQSLKQVPGYVVAWPNPGILNSFPLGFRGRPDEEGFTYSRLLDLWRLEYQDYAALGFDRERLNANKSLWHTEPGERLAQMRLRVGDVSQSHLRGLANTYFYWRSWDASLANMRMVNHLAQQFGLAPETALPAAQQLLGVQMICPLGGTYELHPISPSRSLWISTKWPEAARPRVPEGYQAALFNWFRGLSADVIQTDDQFVIHAILDVHRNPGDGDSPLPSFDLFKGFGQVTSLGGLLGGESSSGNRSAKTGAAEPSK